MSNQYAYVTFVMRSDSFIPGALMLAYNLRRFGTRADIVCLITGDVSAKAKTGLDLLYDHVVEIDTIEIPHNDRHTRQDRPFLCTRFEALRLGEGGGLGFRYKKIILMDADLLPLRNFDHLFSIDAPAGILNERKCNCINPEDRRRTDGKSIWHDIYEKDYPHGTTIPKRITDRVYLDKENMGVNASLLILEPSVKEYNRISEKLHDKDTLSMLADFKWPEMQFATLFWSGRWTNIDIRYSAFNGHPSFERIYGNHYAGLKPWSEKRLKSLKHYARFRDYKYWYMTFRIMAEKDYPGLQKIPKVGRVLAMYEKELRPVIQKLNRRKNLIAG